ncbi:MAG: hypothetical protein ACYDB7_01850 [Mycobacteriales bacterium]
MWGLPAGAPTGCAETFSAAHPAGLGTGSCAQLLAALNQVDPGFLIFSMPRPDLLPDQLTGSPGGYQAVGQRGFYQHLQDAVLNDDSSIQIPGLEVLYVNDSYDRPSRLDVQLADIEAESHYGITPLGGAGGAFTSSTTGLGLGALVRRGGLAATLGPGGAAGSSVAILSSAQRADPAGLVAGVAQLVQRVFAGLVWLLRSPGTAGLVALLLALLASPLFLAARRRRLETLDGGS